MIKKTIKIGFLATLLFLGNKEAYSQIGKKAIRISLANEAIALPNANPFSGPIHPALFLGYDAIVKSKNHWQTAFGFDLGFFHQRLSENALMLDATYSKGYRIGPITPKFLFGLGYKHSMPTSEVYKFEDGEYKKATFLGKPQFNTKLGFGLEYAINQQYSLMADCRMMVALPYSDLLPFSPHTFTGFGLKINILNK